MIKAVLFDLDGVLVSTDEFHYLAWQKMANEEGIPFDRSINEGLRGVSRMESLEVILKAASKSYSGEEKEQLARTKNEYYCRMIAGLTEKDLLPGALKNVLELKDRKIRVAIGSSSKNTKDILRYTGLEGVFDAIADGNDISHSKPDPEVFLCAAKKLGIKPQKCLVVEDAVSGIEAATRANMKSVALGSAREHPAATYTAESLEFLCLCDLL